MSFKKGVIRMPEKKVGIIAECVCDLPKSFLKEHDVEMIYFLIETDNGVFTDTDEITADNVLGYIQSGGNKAKSVAPPPEVYKEIFERNLAKYDQVILVAISSGISLSIKNATDALGLMGETAERVHIFDSQHLSTGLGHIVIKAIEMAETGHSADEVIASLNELKKRVSTTFITENVDFLYHNGKCSEKVKKFCSAFDIHPILVMKNGKLTMKSFVFGNYERAYIRYINKELKRNKRIDKKRLFITCSGCPLKMIDQIKKQVERICTFDEITVTRASATVSSNCGPNTFGVLFVNNK